MLVSPPRKNKKDQPVVVGGTAGDAIVGGDSIVGTGDDTIIAGEPIVGTGDTIIAGAGNGAFNSAKFSPTNLYGGPGVLTPSAKQPSVSIARYYSIATPELSIAATALTDPFAHLSFASPTFGVDSPRTERARDQAAMEDGAEFSPTKHSSGPDGGDAGFGGAATAEPTPELTSEPTPGDPYPGDAIVGTGDTTGTDLAGGGDPGLVIFGAIVVADGTIPSALEDGAGTESSPTKRYGGPTDVLQAFSSTKTRDDSALEDGAGTEASPTKRSGGPPDSSLAAGTFADDPDPVLSIAGTGDANVAIVGVGSGNHGAKFSLIKRFGGPAVLGAKPLVAMASDLSIAGTAKTFQECRGSPTHEEPTALTDSIADSPDSGLSVAKTLEEATALSPPKTHDEVASSVAGSGLDEESDGDEELTSEPTPGEPTPEPTLETTPEPTSTVLGEVPADATPEPQDSVPDLVEDPVVADVMFSQIVEALGHLVDLVDLFAARGPTLPAEITTANLLSHVLARIHEIKARNEASCILPQATGQGEGQDGLVDVTFSPIVEAPGHLVDLVDLFAAGGPTQPPVTSEGPTPPAETVTREDPTPPAETVTSEAPTPAAETVTREDPTPPAETVTREGPTPPAETVTREDPTPPTETVTREGPTPPAETDRVTWKKELLTGTRESITLALLRPVNGGWFKSKDERADCTDYALNVFYVVREISEEDQYANHREWLQQILRDWGCKTLDVGKDEFVPTRNIVTTSRRGIKSYNYRSVSWVKNWVERVRDAFVEHMPIND